jgi:hypothetical protein
MSARGAVPLAVALALAVHSRSLGHDFMSDDGKLILENPQVTQGGHLRELFTTDWFDTGGAGRIGYYRPVVKLSLRATWAIAGGRAWAFHLGNVLSHAVAVFFLALVLVRLLPPLPAAFGASIFAVHPATVQAVDIVTARSDVLAAAFSLAACAALAAFADTGRRVLLVALPLAALAAFGSKESALLLGIPLVALGLEKRLAPRRLAAALVPVFAVEVLFLIVRSRLVHVLPRPNSLATLPVWEKLFGVLITVGVYAGHLVTGLPILRLPPLPTHVTPAVVAGTAILLVASLVLVRDRLRSPACFGIVLLFSSLAPALAIWLINVPRWKDEIPVADRWLYLPAAGGGVLAAVLLARVPRKLALVGGFGVLAVFGAVAVERAGMYRSQVALSDYTAAESLGAKPEELNPRERYFAMVNRAQKHLLAGEIEEGLADLLEADRIAPALPDHLPLIAQAELDLGHPERAVEALERLLSPDFAKNPDAVRQRLDFGNDTMWRFDRATAWHLLGRARWAAGRRAEADAAFSEAAHQAAGRPNEAAYLVDLSASLRSSGKLDAARTALERAAALRPDWDRPRRERQALDAESGGAAPSKDRDPKDR